VIVGTVPRSGSSNDRKLGDSCFQSGVNCDGWIDDPNRATNYTCYYGTHAVALSSCFIYGPLFDATNRFTGHAYGNPVNGELVTTPSSPTDVDDVVSKLLSMDWVTGAAYQEPDNRGEIARSIATQCLNQIGIPNSGATQSPVMPIVLLTSAKCQNLAIYAPGLDVETATRHDLESISDGQPAVLHYESESMKSSGTNPILRSWKGATASNACAAGAVPGVTQCDGYPYFSTFEGGPGASLRSIIGVDNGRQGNQLQQLYNVCGLNTGTAIAEIEYVVVPILTANSVAICSR
jgi:Deoxyribonuclease NucA/NucB